MSSSRPELKFGDNSDERQFHRKLITLGASPPNTLRIMDKGDYYSVFGSDAVFVAETVYKTTSVIKKTSQGVDYVTLSASNMNSFLRQLLFDLGYKCEIYDKEWNLIKFATPGNVEAVEDIINVTSLESSVVTVALKIGGGSGVDKKIGYCFVNTGDRVLGISEFIDNELYSNLEALLIQIDAKDVLILTPSDTNDPDYLKLVGVIDRTGAVISELKASDFNNKDIDNDLSKLLTDELSLSINEITTQPLALSATSAIVKYLGLLTQDSNYGNYSILNHNLDLFMKLDSSALEALNLFPTGNTNSGKNSNLFDLLNHCKSVGGSRLLHQWIKQPLVNKADIETRHNLVDIMKEDTQLRSTLMDNYLNSIPDLKKLTKRLLRGKASNLEDVVRIYQFVIKVPDIIILFEEKSAELDNALIEENWLSQLKEYLTPLLKFQELVETTVDLEALDRHEFVVKPDYDEKLMEYRTRLDEIQAEIHSIHQEIANDLALDAEKKLKLENHQIHGWCMRVTRTDERSIRGHQNFIELQTVKAGVFFTTETMRDIAQESVKLQQLYNKQQSNLVKEIVDISSTYTPVLEKISLVLSHLDVIVAFAHVSSYAPIPYTRPTLHALDSSERKIHLKESRHPCVEMQDDVSFIANDFSLAKSTTEFAIITGPNMGGKSTYIRQLGLISLMSQIGCFIPVEEDAELAIFDAILSRVGAGDSQLKGVSTFMVEMLETASILKTATQNSLIIIDELGRGTSTYDGFGLAWAISDFISSKLKCFTLFATHFHELTKLADQNNNVENLHVVAHVESKENTSQDITLLYKVEQGISDQSFGINVAEVVKFPNKIVSMAKRKANELEEFNDENDAKKLKLSEDDIAQGSKKLIKLLKDWKAQSNIEQMSADEIVDKLRSLVTAEYGDSLQSDTFIKEVLSL